MNCYAQLTDAAMEEIKRTVVKEDEIELSRLGLSYTSYYASALGTVAMDAEKDDTPPGINVELLGHQRLLLAEMRRRENAPLEKTALDTPTERCIGTSVFNCLVLMESIGSGKSYMILSRIIQQPKLSRKFVDVKISSMHDTLSSRHTTYNTMCTAKFAERTVVGNANWIVVPHGIMHQWKGYLDNTSLTYAVFNTAKMVKEYQEFKTKQVWLVTSTKYNDLVKQVAGEPGYVASRLVFDECDTINTVGPVEHHQAAMVWFVSSSAQNIYHPNGDGVAAGVLSKGFIRNVLVGSRRGISSIIVKAPYRYVAMCMRMPVAEEEILLVRDSQSVTSLTGMVPDRILNMLKANDYSGVACHYSLDTQMNEQGIIDHVIAKMADKIKATASTPGAIVPAAAAAAAASISTTTTDTDMAKLNAETAKLNESIAIIKDRIHNYDRCMICLDDDIKGKCITPCCLASWCMSCILNSLYTKTSCPKCRMTLLPHELMTVAVSSKDGASQVLYANKEAAFVEILSRLESGSAKLLVFTEYNGGTECIKVVCGNKGIKARELKGRNDVVKKTIAAWEAPGDTSVLVLNAVHYGAGLNLQKGTDVVFWHKFGAALENSAIEQQVLGRVLRLGMSHTPKVWRIYYQSE